MPPPGIPLRETGFPFRLGEMHDARPEPRILAIGAALWAGPSGPFGDLLILPPRPGPHQ